MKIKKNGFYTLKEDFFKKINDPNIPQKNKRPVYYCIEDKYNKDLIWVIPMTSQITKANKFISKYGEKKCYNFEINTTMNNSVFNIQDIFPVINKYIDKEYKVSGEHYIIKDNNLIKSVEKKARKFIAMGSSGEKAFSTSINVIKIKSMLEEELKREKEILNKEKVQNLVKETIKKEIPKDNYNALTGSQIIIENHSSGDKRWIAMADIRANNITIKNNQKPTLTIVLHDENGKLYAMPIEYYNVSQLNITKELEQKFIPMKEKEKSVEKSKDKGIER